MAAYSYKGQPLPEKLTLSADRPVIDYFKQFPGLDAGARYNGDGFWKLPIPVSTAVAVDPNDVVVYDADPRLDLGVLSAPRRVILRGALIA